MASAGPQSSCESPERLVEQAQEDPERRGLRRHRHEGRDRRGGALVDVGRPLVEGRNRCLEREPGDGQPDPGEKERVGHVQLVACERGGDAVEAQRTGRAIDQREPIEERGRAHRAHDEVLEPGLERGAPPQVRRAQHVQRDRQQLEPDEERHEALGLGEHDHARDRAEQQRVVLAVARLERRGRSQRQQDRHEPRHEAEHRDAERERVDAQRALHDRLAGAGLPDPDRQADRREQRDRGERGDHGAPDEERAEQADQQHDHRAAGHREQR